MNICKDCNRDRPLNRHERCLLCQRKHDNYEYVRDKPNKREHIKDMDNQIKILLLYREDLYDLMDRLFVFAKAKEKK